MPDCECFPMTNTCRGESLQCDGPVPGTVYFAGFTVTDNGDGSYTLDRDGWECPYTTCTAGKEEK